ncbi:MAG: glycerol-3-phosphate cytidylyltransferase [Pseudonocardiales bacterium]|nr:MAG: glycerol-3-phosphate cytidylyltransferase [Pseudonocardiales bacterium]
MTEMVGYTTGVYDMFHIGHLNVLRNARQLCDRLVVGVTTDELCEERKGKLPIVPHRERMDIVSSIRYVDEVVPQASMDKMQAWREIGFHRMFVGDDWRGTPSWDRLERDFSLIAVELLYLPYTKHTSSTSLRAVLFGA